MPNITFIPSDKRVHVPETATLLDAAREAGVELEAPCGGRGTCGRCVVRVVAGSVFCESYGLLSREAVNAGDVLACHTRAGEQNVVVEIPQQPDASMDTGTSEQVAEVDESLFPTAKQRQPLASSCRLSVPPPVEGDGFSDIDRLARALGNQCTCEAFSLYAIRHAADALRGANGRITAHLAHTPLGPRVIDVFAADRSPATVGIAVDMGTTTVAVQLVSLRSGMVLATESAYNGQVACGADVIGRINYASGPQRLEELRRRGVETVNKLIANAAARCGIRPHQICAASVAGNTTMTHLLLGLLPEYIRLDPYTPTVLEVPQVTAAETGIDINPAAPLDIAPAVGSYVGGDITAGLLCTAIAGGTDELCLYLDIGTNGELVIGNDEFLMGCACSAGPAFEGGGIGCGMRAAAGAIDHVAVDRQTGCPSIRVIGGGRPRGICGSGIISLVAELFLAGWLDPDGKLDRHGGSEAIRTEGRTARYVIAGVEESATGDALFVDESDIQNVIRAKAAIYAAASLLLEQLDLSFADIARFYVAGGFGRYVDLQQAKAIGLLPDIPDHHFHYVGNASLTGSYMALISADHRRLRGELASRLTYVELSAQASYMDQYTAALFLPHTDTALFPTVGESAQKRRQ